jgi:hypothetical protein
MMKKERLRVMTNTKLEKELKKKELERDRIHDQEAGLYKVNGFENDLGLTAITLSLQISVLNLSSNFRSWKDEGEKIIHPLS